MLVGDIDAQARLTFENIDRTLKSAGGSLANMVFMTIYVRDEKYRSSVQKIRDEMFKEGKYPATTFLIQSWLPQPDALVYINGAAVIE
jgi:2-iminobutanoate/2-iminopropanoate deaminase